jgi:hypothetical protein
MKKIFSTILILGLLLSGNAFAKTKNIGNGLSINIPNNYKYFEITVKQLVSRFPDIELNELDDEFGIGLGAKLIVIANNKKTIKFFDDVTSVSGLEKLNRKHLQPIIKKFSDPKFTQSLMKDMQKFAPNADLESMNEEELMELMGEVMVSPKMTKKYKKIFKPYANKFDREYDLSKYTVLLVGDKKAEFLDEIKDQDINYLNRIVRDKLIEIYQESKDPTLKDIKDWQFEITKNHNGNLYLYSNENVQSPYISTKYFQELFLTSHEDKILLAISVCVEKCNGSTDFLNIIKPTNLYVESNFNTEATDISNLTKQLKTLNELYKSGALTKEEFTKAKNKLLN